MPGHSDDKASPGQPFRAPKAETWNGMVDAGNAYRAGRLSNGVPQPTRPRETDIIKLKNSSSGNRARGQILRIDGKAITDLSDEHIWLIGQAPTADDYFGILKEPIADGEIGRVQVSGCCLALVDVIDADHTRAKAVDSEYVLESSDDGPLEILFAPGGTGEQECVVRFASSGGGAELYAFTLTANMASKSAAASISTIDGVSTTVLESSTVYDPQDIFAVLETGDSGLCLKQGGKYYIIQANCPADGGGGGGEPPMGCCSGSEFDPPFQQVEDECLALGLTWTPGDCP